MINKRVIGSEGEKQAEKFLIKKGYGIIEKNYKYERNEIDIIAYDKEYLVFIEVKKRRSLKMGYPSEAVDERKQKSIIKAAQGYILTHNYVDRDCRFDVVEIIETRALHEIRLIKNAFEVR